MRISRRLKNIYPEVSVSPTVHLVLVHSPEILDRIEYNFGKKTEESMERSNKVVRHARMDHSRKKGRIENMVDMVHWCMEDSDILLNLIK